MVYCTVNFSKSYDFEVLIKQLKAQNNNDVI